MINDGVWTKEEIDRRRDKVFRDSSSTAKWIRTLDEKDAQIKSLQDSIINACERVIAETEHKPVNASALADLVIKSEVRENDIVARADMADLFKEDRIEELEEQLAATTESLSESECSLLISEDIADRLQNKLAAVIQICKTEYDAAYDLKNDILDIVGEAK